MDITNQAVDHIFTVDGLVTVKCPLRRAGSDVTLIVNESRFQCHKKKLAKISPYFKALFFGATKESQQSEIQLHGVFEDAFAMLLIYIYGTKITLECLTIELEMKMFHVAHKFAFDHLASMIEDHFKSILNLENFSFIYEWMKYYDRKALAKFCRSYSDAHSKEILISYTLVKDYDVNTLKDILSSDFFYANEIDIFNLISQVFEYRGAEVKELIEVIRLPLIGTVDLRQTVLPTSLFSEAQIETAEQTFMSSKVDVQLRGCLIPGKNVATAAFNVEVMKEDFTHVDELKTFNIQNQSYYVRHEFDTDETDWGASGGIIIKLEKLFFVNCIKMLLQTENDVQYKYFVEVFNGHKWYMIADYRNEFCSSWQTIYFPSKPINYIRVVGTRCNKDSERFAFTGFQCCHTDDQPNENPANDNNSN